MGFILEQDKFDEGDESRISGFMVKIRRASKQCKVDKEQDDLALRFLEE